MQEVKIHNAVMYLFTQYVCTEEKISHTIRAVDMICATQLNTTMSSAKVVGGKADLCTLWQIISLGRLRRQCASHC